MATNLFPVGDGSLTLLRTLPVVIIGLSFGNPRKSVRVWGSEATLVKREPSAVTRIINDNRFGAFSEQSLKIPGGRTGV